MSVKIKNLAKHPINIWYRRKLYWLHQIVSNSGLWHAYKDVKYTSSDTPNAIAYRNKKLKDILTYAVTNVPFYKDIKLDDLSSFPVINKSIISANRNLFICNNLINNKLEHSVVTHYTSGSTGTPFEIFLDKDSNVRRIATIKYENERIGFKTCMPMMQIRSLKHYSKYINGLCNKSCNIIYIDNANLNNDRIVNILEIINKYKIQYIRSYMTSIDIISRYAVENNIELKHHPTFISSGERLTPKLADRVRDILHCNIISQYATEENGVLGSSNIQDPTGNIYLNRANCFVEILKLNSDMPADKGEPGRVVVTDFTNYVMPFIRYDTGDIAIAGDYDENNSVKYIYKLMGRNTDLIYNTSGKLIDLFNSLPADIFNNHLIKQYQFIQESLNTYTLILNTDNEHLLNIENIKIKLMKILGEDAVININLVNNISILNSGKFKIVINKLSSNPSDQ